MRERDEWQQKADAQICIAVAAAEAAVKINGIAKGDIDAELQYQAQQVTRQVQRTEVQNHPLKYYWRWQESVCSCLSDSGATLCLQMDFMYESMKEAKAKMTAMRRELEVAQELQTRLTVQNHALHRAVDILARADCLLPICRIQSKTYFHEIIADFPICKRSRVIVVKMPGEKLYLSR